MAKKLFVLVVTAMILLIASVPALATPSTYVEGDWFYHPRLDELEMDVAGGNTFISTVEDSRWNGAFAGSEACVATLDENCAASVDVGTVVFHRSGRANFNGWVYFDTVSVDGMVGSLEMRVNGTKVDPETDWQGRWVITGGELHEAGLRGRGPWWGPGWQEVPGEWGIIHYSGNTHIESD